ncbi:MAG: hypothetical protein AAGI23_04580 [Bacteroidota bacterium]
MRNHPILLLMLSIFSHTVLLASTPPTALHAIYHTDAVLTEVVMTDLVSNVWYEADQEFIFNESGLVIVKATAQNWATFTWQVEINNNSVLLNLYDGRCDKIVYRLERSGDMYHWMNTTTNTVVKMDSTPAAYNEKMMTARRSLVGSWKSRFFPKKVIQGLADKNQISIMSADFNYVLSADGTFQKVIFLNQEKHATVSGLWEVASDGHTLVLHVQGEDCNYQTIEADIKLLSMDELVLDQALATTAVEKQICQNKETFFYNKQ